MTGHEIVIGFHALDDLEVPPKNTRWVTQFCTLFSNRLRMLCSPEPTIWTFGDIPGYEKISDARAEAIREAQVLVAVLSRLYSAPDPQYKAHWEHLAQAIGPEDFATRLFRVYKLRPATPLDSDVRGYRFWRDEKRPIELSPESEEFALRLNELAYEVEAVLTKARAEARAATVPSPPTVFLASVPAALAAEREEVRLWLRGQRVAVLPEALIHRPDEGEKYTRWIEEQLSKSQLSVHFLTPTDNTVTQGSPELSAVYFEYERARSRIEAGEMVGIAWSPPDFRKNGIIPEAGGLGELFTEPILEFDNFIGQPLPALYGRILLRLRQPLDPAKKQEKRVYVVGHPADERKLDELIKELKGAAYQVERTNLPIESPDFRQEFEAKLGNAHAAVICGGNAPSNFLAYAQQTALEEILANVNIQLDRLALYAGPDRSTEKELFVKWAPFKTKIVDYSGFRMASLSSFLSNVFRVQEA